MALNKRKLKFLLVSADKFPPFRVDVTVLFGKEFGRRGHQIDWLLQSEKDCKKAYTTTWLGNRVFVGAMDNGKSTRHRLRKYLLRVLHNFKMVPLAIKNHYDFIQVKDLFLPALLAVAIAKFQKRKFFYWLSFPIPEANLFRYRIRDGKYYKIYLINGMVLKTILYKIILPAADHVFAQSEQMKLDLMAEGIPEDKITPVPMGIEIDEKTIELTKCKIRDGGSEKKLLYLGTMAKARKLDFILRVFKLVLNEAPSCKLYMVGSSANPEDLEWLKATAAVLDVDKKVVFTGNLSRSDAFEYVREADICLSPFAPLPILNSTSPTKLVEYFLWGKATVANDHPEQSRVIAESQGGLCVPYNEKAFAEAIVSLIKNEKQAHEMGQSGREYVLKNRNYEIIASNVEKKYIQILHHN